MGRLERDIPGRNIDLVGRDGLVNGAVVRLGTARLTAAGEELALEPGDAVRVDPETTRQLELHGDSQMVVVGAP